ARRAAGSALSGLCLERRGGRRRAASLLADRGDHEAAAGSRGDDDGDGDGARLTLVHGGSLRASSGSPEPRAAGLENGQGSHRAPEESPAARAGRSCAVYVASAPCWPEATSPGGPMRIGKPGTPVTSIAEAYADRVEVRGRDLCGDLMGRLTFTEHVHL